jgi:hypothetical protein
VRHGVVHLFAAFNVRSGFVLGEVYDDKTHVELIDLLDRCAFRYRQGPVHCILDNAGYHSTPEVERWLSAHPRFRFHFTPTHGSWLNQVESWFSILAAKVLRRGAFETHSQIRDAILAFIAYWNGRAHGWDWKYGSKEILGTVTR